MKKFIDVVLVFLIFIISLIISVIISYFLFNVAHNIAEEKSDDLRRFNISCNGDSMGLSFDCGDYVYVVESNRTYLGKVHVYKDNNSFTAHRAVFRVNDTHIVFKGDNNPTGELVHIDDVIGYVRAVKYN